MDGSKQGLLRGLGGIINPQTLKTRVFSFEIGYLRILEEGLSDISSKAGSRHG